MMTPTNRIEPMSEKSAAEILSVMRVNYGAKFQRQWENVTTQELTSAATVAFAGLSRAEVNHGFSVMIGKPFAPSLPEFREWCLQRNNNFMDVDQAYVLAANEKYESAEIYEAARRTGFYDLKSKHENNTKPTFKKHYDAVCAELLVDPKAFTLPESHRIEQAPALVVRKTPEEIAAMMKNALNAI